MDTIAYTPKQEAIAEGETAIYTPAYAALKGEFGMAALAFHTVDLHILIAEARCFISGGSTVT